MLGEEVVGGPVRPYIFPAGTREAPAAMVPMHFWLEKGDAAHEAT